MKVTGTCHCGATRFEVSVEPDSVTSCTCSYCSKRGALWAYYTPEQFTLLTPRENMATYLWNSRTCHHHFCPTCGCSTFGESPDYSTGVANYDHPKIAINARLFDDFDLGAIPITLIDGKNLW